MQSIDLCGAEWSARQDTNGESFPARVPGCVHTDLLTAGRIEDPFFRDNEDRLRWVSEADWTYERTVNVPKSFLDHEAIFLRCEGLDTLAEVKVNGVSVEKTDNMFRLWELDVHAALRPGENRIEIHFSSPLPFMAEKEKIRRMPANNGPKEIAGRAWIRKSPCSFGWDWGPALPTCGIWRPISLVASSGARCTHVQLTQDHGTAGRVGLNLQATLAGRDRFPVGMMASLAFDGQTVASMSVHGTVGATLTGTLDVPAPRLWWPNGMGEQPLYDLSVLFEDEKGVLLDSKSMKVGLRTLRLDRHPDQWGESFQFVVNGIPFFAKGANWIPADTFPTRLTRERYADLLGSARAANMNMIRLWGGGIYEHEDFYRLCDELGLCIWHDFMFACAGYPAFDPEFLANVRAEAEDQVRRVGHHPSIALWCGNNEIEQGWVGETWTDATMSWKDYDALFNGLIPEVVARLDPQRDYWPCSPHTPVGDRKDFNNPDSGDAHLWSVWHGRLPFEWYRTCTHRFNSEFGFQSFPEPRTVDGYTLPEDRNVTSYVMEHHQRSGIGNTVIMQYMLDWYRLPNDFSLTLHLSQILQGMAMKYAVEHWRRAMPRGMGTLYWQLNDCWPVASWSSIDSHGRWKALHYMAAHFNAPILVSGLEDATAGTVEVHLTSDLLADARGTVSWTVTDLEGEILDRGSQGVSIPARQNHRCAIIAVKRPLKERGPREILVWLALAVDGKIVSRNLVHFARPKHLELRHPRLLAMVKTVEGESREFDITVTCKAPALWSWLDLECVEGRFSENYFHVSPHEPRTVRLSTAHPQTRTRIESALTVRSLRDTYQ